MVMRAVSREIGRLTYMSLEILLIESSQIDGVVGISPEITDQPRMSWITRKRATDCSFH